MTTSYCAIDTFSVQIAVLVALFNRFSISVYDPGNKELPDQVQEVHATIGWIILALAGLHAGAALVHRHL
jgi:cytochrome b561